MAHPLALERPATDVRAVVVLHVFEHKTMLEIARHLGVPSGTVASRLRRGRGFLERALARRLRPGAALR